MEGGRYSLLHGDERVGDVVERVSLGSEAQGTIAYDHQLAGRLAGLVGVTQRMWASADAGDDHAQETAATELDADFSDLVHSAGWRLVDGQGRSRRIHCPDLREGTVGWCWDDA